MLAFGPPEDKKETTMQIARTCRNEPEPCRQRDRSRSLAAGLFMKTSCSLAALAVVLLGMPGRSLADPPFVYNVENTGTNYAGITNLPPMNQLPLVQPLPDPFLWLSSYTNRTFNSRSTNFVDWEQHRNEIAALIQKYEIGTKPTVDPSQITASYTNGVLTVTVTNGANTPLTLTCPVSFPAGGTNPYPMCIGLDTGPYGALPSSLFTGRGIAGISFSSSQVTPSSNPQTNNAYYKLYPNLNPSNTGQYSAWAWGVSRLIDGLYKLNGVLGTNQIDLNHIAVTGCSYAGKMALFSGAFDERIALTVAQESGGGGANSWRYNHTQPSGSVEDIDNTDYSWFEDSMMQFSGNNVSYLPDDHHELDAMVAPRALYVTGNTDYTWLGNPSCLVCSMVCRQIYTTLGLADRFGFNVDGGHTHCAFPNDQTNDLAYFLDKFMLGKTNLSSVVGNSGITYTRWIQWWGTANPAFPELNLSIPAATTKGAGTLAGQGNVGINGLSSTDLVVNLSSTDTTKLTVPASVVISAGQSNTLFDLTVPGNSLLDGDQQVTVFATSPNFNTAQVHIIIHDTNTTTLSVTLPASASESDGTLTSAGSVSIGTPVAADFAVNLTSSDTSRLIVPATTVIPNGQTSAVFDLTFVNNTVIEGPQNVSVTAHVSNWTDGSNSLTILDDDLTTPFHFAWSAVSSPQQVGQAIHVTITAEDAASNVVDFRLPVTLSALMAGSTMGTNTILNSPSPQYSANDGTEYVLGYAFTPSANLEVTAVRSYFGDKVSLWTASGQLLASQNVVSGPGAWADTVLPAPVVLAAGATYVITTHESATYYFSGNLPAAFANGTINQSLFDYGDVFPTFTDTAQWYLVDLRYSTNVTSVTVNPTATGNFTTGVWSGNITVLQVGTNVMLQASAGAGHGSSNPFNVQPGAPAPTLTITPVAGSVVISWPVAATGFNLEQTANLSAGSWTTETNYPSVVGSNNVITNTPTATATFYRLHKP
jgi:hypothetical protein